MAASAPIIGIEFPYLLDRQAYPIDWLLKNIPDHWSLSITSLPAVMQQAAKNPKAGLASTSEPDRKIAVELLQKIQYYADKLQQALTRKFHRNSAAACESLMDTASVSHCSSGGMRHTAVVTMHRLPCLHQAARRLATNHHEISGLSRSVDQSINLYSSPSLFSNSTEAVTNFVVSASSPLSVLARLKTDFSQRRADALERSLVEIKKMNWDLIALNLEHCDAFVSSHPPEKGFLSLEDEVEVLKQVGDIGLVLNWGRSAIETRSVEGPLQHLRLALSHQLLRGFVFSGCTADPNSLYGAWKDCHAPPYPFCPESLLGKKEIMQALEEAKKENQELSLGIKISNRFVPFDIKRSIELNLETINLFENTMRDCRRA